MRFGRPRSLSGLLLIGFALSRGPDKPRVAFLNEVPADDLVVHCAIGLRGYLATRVLEQHRNGQGWGRIRNLDGGMKTWLAGTGA